jgi:hypothetical protein
MNIRQELELIRKKSKGVLKAEDVVKYARNPKTALHSRFEWNNAKAGYEYRLWQARELIRISVLILPIHNKPVRVRAYVSLTDDRTERGGGYRSTIDVLLDKNQRKKLLKEAFEEMKRFEEKYAMLTELAEVISSMRNVRKKLKAVS